MKKNENIGKNKKEINGLFKKNYLFVIIIMLIIIITVVVFIAKNIRNNDKGNTYEKDDAVYNTNEGVVGDKEVDGLKFTSTSLVYKDGVSTLETLVSNNTGSDYFLEEFHIIVKDENNNYIINYVAEDDSTVNYLVGYVGDNIISGESKTITTSIDFDISSSAYTISYEIVK